MRFKINYHKVMQMFPTRLYDWNELIYQEMKRGHLGWCKCVECHLISTAFWLVIFIYKRTQKPKLVQPLPLDLCLWHEKICKIQGFHNDKLESARSNYNFAIELHKEFQKAVEWLVRITWGTLVTILYSMVAMRYSSMACGDRKYLYSPLQLFLN